MKIGIIGAGQIGGTLTRRLTALGHKVFVRLFDEAKVKVKQLLGLRADGGPELALSPTGHSPGSRLMRSDSRPARQLSGSATAIGLQSACPPKRLRNASAAAA
jgi:hypothetical protein